MANPWRTSIITRIEDITPNTKRFWFEIPELDRFDFKPGQFVTLDLPIHEKLNKRMRSYSIASHPNGTNTIELVIVLVESGAGTTYLFNEAAVGTKVPLLGAQGVFTLPNQLDKDIYLICTGTGIAPFRSMLHYIHEHNVPHQNIYLIFGCRHFEDCLYRDEMTELEKAMPAFHYIPTFSREMPQPGIRTGYVHDIYEELIKENTTSQFYLCGWKNMITEARQRLSDKGFTKNDIHFELYG